MANEVLFDGWCGEPIAWARVGESVIGHEWTERGRVAVTGRLTPAEAVRKYGPITEVVLGRQGGFKSVTYGEKKFVSRFVDPRGTGLYDESVVVVDDPAREDHECPVCEAAPGEPCVDAKQRPRGTHNKRSQGRSRWDIERAEEGVRKAREEAEAAERMRRKVATPPAVGAVLEVHPWNADPQRFTVERTFANRTVEATSVGEQVFLARNEYNGNWHLICGQPTTARLPCKGGVIPRCQAQHRAGLRLRDDEPWNEPPRIDTGPERCPCLSNATPIT
jgi:hypothetical protein